MVTAISNAATQDAGATVTGQIALQPKFFDNSDTTLDGLNQTNLAMSQADNIVLNTGTPYQQQAAQVIASEILTRAAGSAGPAPAASRAPARRRAASRHQRADHARGVRQRGVPDHQRAALGARPRWP